MTLRATILLLLPCALALEPIEAQENLGFERHTDEGLPSAWTVEASPGYDVTIDETFAFGGRYSLRISGTGAEPGAAAQVEQSIDAAGLAGNQVRVTAFLRSEGVLGTRVFVHALAQRANGTVGNDAHQDFTATGHSDWHRVSLAVPLTEDVVRITMAAYLEGDGSAWFDNFTFEVVDTNNLPPPSPDVEVYVTSALDLMEENAIRTDAIDWQRLRESVMESIRGVSSIQDAYSALRLAVYYLGDWHSSFMTPEQVSVLSSVRGDTNFDRAWLALSGKRLKERISYVSIPAFGGVNQVRMTRFADEIQSQIRRLDSPDVCGWVVDLTENRGGNVFPMLAGLGSILGERHPVNGHRVDGAVNYDSYEDGRVGPAKVSGAPYALHNPEAPVAVLIGPETASSGEMVAIAFIGRPDTRLFGRPTRGITTGNRLFPLADGAAINLANSVMVDSSGNSYTSGVVPDEIVDSDHSGFAEDDPITIQRALSWLEREHNCP